MSSERDVAPAPERGTDRGAVLVMALVLVVLCALITVPLLTYATAITEQRNEPAAQMARIEAAKAGLRTALLNPTRLYTRCSTATATTSRVLPTVDLGDDVTATTKCFALSSERREPEGEQRIALGVTQVGATVPTAPWAVGTPYAAPSADPAQWVGDTRANPRPGKVWLPKLPQRRTLPPVSSTGYAMADDCRVYLPGIYTSPVTITGPAPTYFASGVYYFEEPITFGRDAKVVAGDGATAGCTTDLLAATTARNGPSQHQVSGGGVTFVFGRNGRMVVDDTGTTGSVSIVFNQRYPATSRLDTDSTKGISMISVNGASDSPSDYSEPNTLFVPRSTVFGTPATTLADNQYAPSTVTATPIVSVSLSTGKPVNLSIPGYIAVPQGNVQVSTTNATNKTVSIGGGVLARTMAISSTVPANFEFGLTNPIDVYTFRIVSKGRADGGTATSTATVRVRYDGLNGISAWEIKT